ncbi:MAG TPA: hypothetical protein VLY63_19745 [Anaerolineae bacterium]|nr:hypothetical protein [Anaerolineae bacterium]
MAWKSLLASVFSLLVPGLGQIYTGQGGRGAAILLAAIVIGNLNAIWLSLYGLTNPEATALWTYTLPRILHDLSGVWAVVFYIWQAADAYHQVKRHTQHMSVPEQNKAPT